MNHPEPHHDPSKIVRDSGVCIPETELDRLAEYARLSRIPYCEQCGHRVPLDYPCEHLEA